MPVIDVKIHNRRVTEESVPKMRAAIDFYTELVTVYQDAPLA